MTSPAANPTATPVSPARARVQARPTSKGHPTPARPAAIAPDALAVTPKAPAPAAAAKAQARPDLNHGWRKFGHYAGLTVGGLLGLGGISVVGAALQAGGMAVFGIGGLLGGVAAVAGAVALAAASEKLVDPDVSWLRAAGRGAANVGIATLLIAVAMTGVGLVAMLALAGGNGGGGGSHRNIWN